jgi:coenzyme F420 hydrogenase subunit beta
MVDNGEHYYPKINRQLCVNCGSCAEVCPVCNYESISLLSLRGKIQLSGFNGDRAYMGYSLDDDIRFNASSGGLVTSLLILALEEKLVDGVLVTAVSSANPLRPMPFIAKSKADLLLAIGSKYCPVPLNEAVKIINNSKGRFAVVGLPCHINGLKKLEEKIPDLKNKIPLHFGLFCSHTLNFKATLFLLRLLRGTGKQGNLSNLEYRGKGWPGYFSVTYENGEKAAMPFLYYSRFHALFFFTPHSCMFCPDAYANLADLSFGDAWSKGIMSSDTQGTSACISRTIQGQRLLEKAVSLGKIHLLEMSDSQVHEMLLSTAKLRRAIAMSKLQHKHFPVYTTKIEPKLSDYVAALIYYFNNNVLANNWALIPHISKIEYYLLHALMNRIK